MSNSNTIYSEKYQVNFGHLFVVLVAGGVLLGFTWLRHPSLFSQEKNSAGYVTVPKYYAYQAPAETNLPQVAGASTQNEGPSIINEDGSVSSINGGEVLGASTNDLVNEIASVSFKVAPSGEAAVKKYLAEMDAAEYNFAAEFGLEDALMSKTLNQIAEKQKVVEKIILQMKNISVPADCEFLHKSKLAQYMAAKKMVELFPQADAEPENLSFAIQVFLQGEESSQNEMANLSQKYPRLFNSEILENSDETNVQVR